MEILRPQTTNGSSQVSLKGKIKITTRCLWLDKGKLLDALYKAAYASLSSCPVNCPLAHMERIVCEVLRKMVRRYSSKRPEVIAFAVENTTGVLSEELKMRLSGQSQDDLGLSAFSRPSDRYLRQDSSRKLHEDAYGEAVTMSDSVEEEGDSVDAERLMSQEHSFLESNFENVTSYDSIKPEHSLGSFKPPSGEVSDVEDGLLLVDDPILNDKGEETKEEPQSLDPQPKVRASAKRNKWKPEEIKRLIRQRGELDSRFQAVKGRMVLWEEISASMLNHGIVRTPAQCKSLWASLVQKYEECKDDENSKKSWPYFTSVHKILSLREEAFK